VTLVHDVFLPSNDRVNTIAPGTAHQHTRIIRGARWLQRRRRLRFGGRRGVVRRRDCVWDLLTSRKWLGSPNECEDRLLRQHRDADAERERTRWVLDERTSRPIPGRRMA
jgi:hypothetical protein